MVTLQCLLSWQRFSKDCVLLSAMGGITVSRYTLKTRKPIEYNSGGLVRRFIIEILLLILPGNRNSFLITKFMFEKTKIIL
jgi:hypothetical protein